MNESINQETPRKRAWSSWSCVRRSQIFGAVVGMLLTIGIIVLCTLIRPNLYSILGFLGDAIMAPSIWIARMFGLSSHWFVNDKTGGPAVFPLCIMIIINAMLGFLLGTLVGVLKKCNNAKWK